MRRSDFEEGLRELDAEYEKWAPPASFDASRSRPQGPRRFVLAVVALVVVLAAGWFGLRPDPEVGGFTVRVGSAYEPQAGRVGGRAGPVTLLDVVGHAELQLERDAVVERGNGGVRVHRGVVRFDVEHGPQRTYSVFVSGGVIEVLGTTFDVTQNAQGGEVMLERGSIRFRATDGREVMLAPGETVRWPLPAVVVPEPERGELPAPPRPAPVRLRAPTVAPPREAAAPPFSSEAVLAEVASLRSRGRFADAVSTLSAALARTDLMPLTRERLGFELGSILTYQLHDGPRACAHWQALQREFPQGRYAREVASSLDSLQCRP